MLIKGNVRLTSAIQYNIDRAFIDQIACLAKSGKSKMQGLGDINNGDGLAIAYDVSADGAKVVGEAREVKNIHGHTWRRGFRHSERAYTLLDNLENSTFAHVRGVSGDGQRIVGSNRVYGDHPGDGAAVIWDGGSLAIFSIQEGLYAAGIDLAVDDWELNQANTISADGSTIVGFGTHNGVREGWVVTLAASTAIPIPVAAWLFGSSLLGLIGIRRLQ